MKGFFTLLLFFIVGAGICQVSPQKLDSLSVQKHKLDTGEIRQQAPEALQNLFDKIVQEETQKVEQLQSQNKYNLEIDGLIIDETKTKNGREFYDYFFRDWEAPEGARNFTIFIEEKPFRLNTTLIEILINDTMIYQSLLQPRSEFLENLAQESISTTQMYLANYEELLKQLGGNDMKGTGLF